MKKPEKSGNPLELPASFTVEAALVIPFILMILAMLIQMTLYLTDTVRLEAIMAESALTEDGEETPEAEGVFLLGDVSWEAKKSGGSRKLSGRAQSDFVMLGKKVTWKTSLSHECRECAASLRRIYLLIQAAKSLGG